MWISAVSKPEVPEYAYHQVLWSYFPDVPEVSERPFVYRVLGDTILMLSRHRPSAPTVKALAERIEAGAVYQFDLLANPARSARAQQPDGTWKRICRKPYRTNQERKDWLARRMEGSGAEITFVQAYDRPQRRFAKPGGKRIIIDDVVFRGTLRVTDKARFCDHLLRGIGGRGAWGCGLMVLPEVMA